MPSRAPLIRYFFALALCTLTTIVALPLRGALDLANIVMIFLLTVFVVAVRFGRGPAVLTAFLSVALFDLFFVPPHLSFTVVDAQYLITFAVMLAVGLITSHLAARITERTEAAQSRERETHMLYELARDLGAALAVEQVSTIIGHFLGTLKMDAALLIDEGLGNGKAFTIHGQLRLDAAQAGLAQSAYRQNTVVKTDDNVFLPFSGATRVRGVLAVTHTRHAPHPLLEAVASLAGIAIERLHYADVAQRSELDVEAEKLRSSILSSISHDLRTPLTSLVGLADTLADRQAGLPTEAIETAGIIRDQAHAMHRMVTNLLEMARLQSGRVVLNKQWQPFEEIIGSSVRLLDDILAQHRIEIDLPADLPLLCFDAVPMERVLCNLLENAAKYSAPGSIILITGRLRETSLEVAVCNKGAGFPPDHLDRVFDPFVRGLQEPAVPGTGIGLAVCRTIVAAHGGTIVAENAPGGACVRFTLPLGTPPAVEGELS